MARNLSPLLACSLFSALEFLLHPQIGAARGVLGIHPRSSTPFRHQKQQFSELPFTAVQQFSILTRRECCRRLRKRSLGSDAPYAAESPGAVDRLWASEFLPWRFWTASVPAEPTQEDQRDPFQAGCPMRLFLPFDTFPMMHDLIRCLCLFFTKHMRMPSYQLVGQTSQNRRQRKTCSVLSDIPHKAAPATANHPTLPAHGEASRPRINCFEHFEGLFQRVGTNREPCSLAIPGASCR